MNIRRRLFAMSIALAITAAPFLFSYGQDQDSERPGAKEAASVDRANAEIDKVYKQLLSKLDDQQKKSLQEAQRAWIKWRDAEAEFVARLGGAVGGSALRVDYSNAQAKLIEERTEVLKDYIKEAENNQ